MMDKVVLYVDEANETRWRKISPNGNLVADSGDGYANWEDAVVAAVREAGDTATVHVEVAGAHIQLDSWVEAGYGKPGE